MKYLTLFLVLFILPVIKYEGVDALNEVIMANLNVSVPGTSAGFSSSGILKSHSFISYDTGTVKNLTLKAPNGYNILAAIRVLDLRPKNKDTLTLSAVYGSSKSSSTSVTYSNPNSKRQRIKDAKETRTFTSHNGQLGVVFVTGPGSSYGYDGFELTYTVFSEGFGCSWDEFRCKNYNCISNLLICDGHNHCGDRSEQNTSSCVTIPGTKKSSPVGIICGIVLLLVAVICGIFIFVRRLRRDGTKSTVITTHPPPPTYPPPTQPGTYYPPPPPHYSQYPQGQVNPTYH